MQQTNNNRTKAKPPQLSVLAALRDLVPNRPLQLSEAFRLAEIQAARMLRLCHVTDGPVPIEIVTTQPHIALEVDSDLPTHAASGCSHWDARGRSWVISLNPEEPATRQRFTALHEYKHILDHFKPRLANQPKSHSRLDPIEYVADYFAGCVLMPKPWLKAAFFGGVQSVSELADLFDVSPRAIEVRLRQIGLTATSLPLARRAHPRYRMQSPAPSAFVGIPSLSGSLATEMSSPRSWL